MQQTKSEGMSLEEDTMDSNIKGALIATAVAGLMGCAGENAAAPASTTGATEGKAKCVGLNACKGQGACAQEGHACGAQNACKGKGVTLVKDADECKAKGGSTL